MNITKNLNGDQLTVALEGRLDTLTAPEFENVVKTELSAVKDLTIDMAKLEYISSAGLRTLLMAKKTLSGRGDLKIVNANEIVKEVFEVTGFDSLLDIE